MSSRVNNSGHFLTERNNMRIIIFEVHPVSEGVRQAEMDENMRARVDYLRSRMDMIGLVPKELVLFANDEVKELVYTNQWGYDELLHTMLRNFDLTTCIEKMVTAKSCADCMIAEAIEHGAWQDT